MCTGIPAYIYIYVYDRYASICKRQDFLPPAFSLLPPSAAFRNVRDGAATTINCCVNPDLKSQTALYYSDCGTAQPSALAR